MAEQEQWWEERNGQNFCRKHAVPLQTGYKPRSGVGGWMQNPPLECPVCHRQLIDHQRELNSSTHF